MKRNRSLLLGALALVWSVSASAVPVATTSFGAPDLTVVGVTSVLWQTESTPCNGSDGGSPSMFILDPGCAVRSGDGGATFFSDTDLNLLPGLPLGTDLTNGLPATLSSDGTTATLTIAAAIWGPVVKNNVDSPGLVTVTAGTVTDFVLTIDAVSGAVTGYSWTAVIGTVIGPGALVVQLDGPTANWYSAEAIAGPDADGALVWICGGGGLLAQPANTPGVDPGSLGTCGGVNDSPTVTDSAYNTVSGAIYANASSATLALTPRAWAPVDGRISALAEPATMLLLGSGLAGLGIFGRHRRRA